MFKPVLVPSPEQFRQAQPQVDAGTANNVFKVLHGYYGNLFLSKFATQRLDANGHDTGVLSAQKVWAAALSGYDASIVVTALERCQTQYQEFPPSLPQFLEICKAAQPVKRYRPEAVPVLEMSQGLRSKYAAQAREIVARHNDKTAAKRAGVTAVPAPTLSGLLECIANAVATAGGDEVRELQRLGRLFPQGASA